MNDDDNNVGRCPGCGCIEHLGDEGLCLGCERHCVDDVRFEDYSDPWWDN